MLYSAYKAVILYSPWQIVSDEKLARTENRTRLLFCSRAMELVFARQIREGMMLVEGFWSESHWTDVDKSK